jgi:hypothetical protein
VVINKGNEMNGRLQELAREAGFFANPDIEKFEKFTELLMIACADNLYFHGHVEACEQLEWFRKKLLQKNNSNNG